jgi:uncharacterized protein (DUF362 family)
MHTSKHTRRKFLRGLAAAPAALWALASGEKAASEPVGAPVIASSSPAGAKVVVAKRKTAADAGGKVNPNEVADLLGKSIVAVTGKSDQRAAWKSLFGKKDVVGIKVNCLAGYGLSSHPELVSAIVGGLAEAGVAKENIIIWDRAGHELSAAGFSSKTVAGARTLGTDSRGAGYEDEIEFSGEIGSCFSTILSRLCTAVINVPVLKDHDLSGVSLGMKNFYGAIHNPNKYHDDNCDPYIADLNRHPLIAKKMRLVVCDGLKGQYHGGPASREQWAWPAGTLLVGTDPVAVDRIGLELIENKRKQVGMDPLKEVGREAKHIQTAAQNGLGVADIARINRVRVS